MAIKTTRWSMILSASEPDSPEGREALAELSQIYWYPLYAFARRRGRSEEDASELTQGFFVRLLERNLVAKADPARGRFRSFLFQSFKNYLINEHRAASAAKRGGAATRFSIDQVDAERRYLMEPADERFTPERVFERRWALMVVERTLEELRAEYAAKGKEALFERLQPALVGDTLGPYAQLSEELGITLANVKISVHRMRQRFAARLRATVAHTVDVTELPDELRHLSAVLNGADSLTS